VGYQKQMMALPAGTGFGYAPLGKTGPFASLWVFLHKGEAATEGIMEPRLERLLQAHEADLQQASPTCFLDDLTTKNVLVENGELSGLINFDFVYYGDPLFWLGLTKTVIILDLGTRELFYADELCRFLEITPQQRRRIALYAAWISLGFLQKAAGKPPEEWYARLTDARKSRTCP
jgi:aminoglycoside phosphotransferase (APT) family kinase protein